MSENTQRTLIPATLALLLALLLVVALLRPSVPALPANRRVVVVVAPSLTLADLNSPKKLPALAEFARTGAVAVTPAPPPVIRRGHHLPDDACPNVDWPVPPGQRTLLHIPSTTDFTVPDGYRTDATAFGDEILKAVAYLDNFPVVALYDDLCRNDRYAPLATTQVTETQRRAAVTRFNGIIARLLSPKGLPPDTYLLLAASAGERNTLKRGESLCPVVLWKRGGTPGFLTSPTTRYTPGLLSRNDLVATVAALMERDSDSSTGRAATILPEKEAVFQLTRAVTAWNFQAWSRRWLDGLPWLLVPFVALMVAAHFAARGNILALRGAYLGMATLLIVDVLLRNPLLTWTPLALSVSNGVRFYGISGAASGLLVGAGLLGTFLIGDHPQRLGLWATIVLTTLLIPTLGGDTGGAIAALGGFVALGVLNAPVVEWMRRVIWLGSPAAALVVGVLLVYLLRNGIAGFIAARTPTVWLANPQWLLLLVGLTALCYYLWRRPSARLRREDYAALLAVFLATGIFLIVDNNGSAAAAACLLCALPLLLVANTHYRIEGGETLNAESDKSEETPLPTVKPQRKGRTSAKREQEKR